MALAFRISPLGLTTNIQIILPPYLINYQKRKMVQTITKTPTSEAIAELKKKIKSLNSKAGQMKMDLHDLAEGLPTDYQKLIEEATKTYEIYRQLAELKQQLKNWEHGS
jgi:hypothetical protein